MHFRKKKTISQNSVFDVFVVVIFEIFEIKSMTQPDQNRAAALERRCTCACSVDFRTDSWKVWEFRSPPEKKRIKFHIIIIFHHSIRFLNYWHYHPCWFRCSNPSFFFWLFRAFIIILYLLLCFIIIKRLLLFFAIFFFFLLE